MATAVMALERVSSGVRSLTGTARVTWPSASARPARRASSAARPASMALLVPPSAAARPSHAVAST